eukprot:4444598-Prymnesium_polylepis.1
MVAQAEAAVAPEDAPLERIGPSTGRQARYARPAAGRRARGQSNAMRALPLDRERVRDGSMQPGAGGA